MGDSTEMTIEFLRARLLSERSVSRSARQRADQLAKRVLELEEQLRIVTIQRKKAEKAAGEVLAILESQGANNFCEVIDSSSDRDHVPGESKGSDENAKGDETSTASRMDRSDVEDVMSGSEVEDSMPQGRSLSWKTRNNSSDSSEKRKEYQTRQRHGRGLVSRVESPSQHLLGKSCRRIKGVRDMGNTLENGRSRTTKWDHTSDCGDDEGHLSKETYDIEREKPEENAFQSSEDQNGGSVVDLYADGFNRDDEEMEKALRQQAQLIGQFQAEENAQREWEEKYNENNSSALAPSEQHEKLINASEEKGASVECDKLAGEASTSDKETKMSHGSTGGQEISVAHSGKGTAAIDSDGPAVPTIISSDMRPSSADADRPMDQLGTAADEHGTGLEEFEFPGPSQADICKKQCQEVLDGNADIGSHSNSNLQACRNEFLGSSSTGSPSSSRSSDKFSKGQWSLIQHQMPEPSNSGLGNVLDALQRARLSLKQEMNKLQPQPMSPTQSGWVTTTDSQSLAIRSSDALGIPFGSAGLFRLPTDVAPQVDLPRSSYLDSGLSMPTLRSNYYGTGLGMPTLRSFAGFSDGYRLNSCTETRTAVTSAIGYPVHTRTGMSTFSSGNSSAATGLTARTPSYDRALNSSYMGARRELSGVDRHTVYSTDRSRLDLGIRRVKE